LEKVQTTVGWLAIPTKGLGLLALHSFYGTETQYQLRNELPRKNLGFSTNRKSLVTCLIPRQISQALNVSERGY